MVDPLRIDQAIAPAGLIRSAVAYSLFLTHGATPHVALVGGRIFVQFLAPTGVGHGEAMIVYRATYDEHCDIAYGRAELLELCQRLVHAAWGSAPPPVVEAPQAELTAADRAASIDKVEQALTLCITRRKNAEQNLGRGGAAEELDRLNRIHEHEIQQAIFERALLLLR